MSSRRGTFTDEDLERYRDAWSRPGALSASIGWYRALRRTMLAGGRGLHVGRVSVPTLILWGAEDRWIPAADADRFAAAIPGARKVVLDGCGHLPQEERPAETLRLVREFLAPGATGGESARPPG